MIVSGYTMDLYCDRDVPDHYCQPGEHVPPGRHRFDEFPHSFLGETFGECQRDARARGWVFHRDGKVSCPRCSGPRP